MKSSMFSNHTFLLRAGVVILAGIGTLVTASVGCDTGGQGERCNPDLSHNECGGGLVCNSAITDCPEAYCCPMDPSQITSNFCQPGCAGGAFSIITSSCSTTTPNPLCACFAGATLLLQSNVQVDAGPECACLATDPDPIANCMGTTMPGGDAGAAD